MRELKGDWRDLFNGFMVALDLRKCFLALLGIFVTICLCGGLTITLGNKLDPKAVEPPHDLVLHKWWRAQTQSWHVIYKGSWEARTTAAGTIDIIERPTNPWIKIGYSTLFILLFLAIWSYFGGAIARIAAFEIAKDGERIETRKALQFSRKKFWSFFWAPLICVIGFFFFAMCNYAGGLVGKLLDYAFIGAPLVALLLPLALLSGFIMTLICVGTLTGLPLFAPAVAAEGTDSFDAVSRGFSYVYSRPWHYLWYQFVSSVYGYVCIAFVILFAIILCHLGISAGAEGFELCGAWVRKDATEFKQVANHSWSRILSEEHQNGGSYGWDQLSIARAPHPYGRLQALANGIVNVDYTSAGVTGPGPQIASFIVTLWLAITLGLSLGYVVSFFLSQQTLIYYILRKKVDGIEMNEVFEEAEPAEEPQPTAPVAPIAEPPKS